MRKDMETGKTLPIETPGQMSKKGKILSITVAQVPGKNVRTDFLRCQTHEFGAGTGKK